jgi:hypothetical protein
MWKEALVDCLKGKKNLEELKKASVTAVGSRLPSGPCDSEI